MNDPDFEALKALPEEEFTRTVEKCLKTLTRRFATLPDEGDIGMFSTCSKRSEQKSTGSMPSFSIESKRR